MKRLILAFLVAFAVVASNSANADIVINEVLASTTSTDTEFIELYNSGPAAVDLSGFEIRQYESDNGGSFGSLDETNAISTGTIAAGGYFLIGNDEFVSIYGITPDVLDSGLSIENSSVTLELFDTNTGTSLYTAFLNDGAAGDAANIAGTLITPDIAIGPDGTFFPAGYYLDGDGGTSAQLLEFSPRPAPSATPGFANLTTIPEPGSALLIGLAIGGIAVIRRRK